MQQIVIWSWLLLIFPNIIEISCCYCYVYTYSLNLLMISTIIFWKFFKFQKNPNFLTNFSNFSLKLSQLPWNYLISRCWSLLQLSSLMQKFRVKVVIAAVKLMAIGDPSGLWRKTSFAGLVRTTVTWDLTSLRGSPIISITVLSWTILDFVEMVAATCQGTCTSRHLPALMAHSL